MERKRRRDEYEPRVLEEACSCGFPGPFAKWKKREGPGPDFEHIEKPLGLELTLLIPRPGHPSFESPLAEWATLLRAIKSAEHIYYRNHQARPVEVIGYQWPFERAPKKEDEIAHDLAEFVRVHCDRAVPFAMFTRHDDLPDGFGVITIRVGGGCWDGRASTGSSALCTPHLLAERISAKNEKLTTYRKNLLNSPIWLLIHSGVDVSGGVYMPSNIGDWSFSFDFERVFFYASLNSRVEEIRRSRGR